MSHIKSISLSKEYLSFKSSIPKKKVTIGEDGTIWAYYDVGPKNRSPLVLLHGTSTTPRMFFYQILALGNRGYRVIAPHFGVHWRHNEWSQGFFNFLKILDIKNCHIFGHSLGGFLALHFVSLYPDMVLSLILCNAFADTNDFAKSSRSLNLFKIWPEFYLKKYVLDYFPQQTPYPNVIDYVVEEFETLKRDELGSRLTLNCEKASIDIKSYDQTKIRILDSTDHIVLPSSMRGRLYSKLPNAKMAYMKEGGDFPMLAVPDDVNMHILVHLKAMGEFPCLTLPKNTQEEKKESPKSPEKRTQFFGLSSPGGNFLEEWKKEEQQVAEEKKIQESEEKKKDALCGDKHIVESEMVDMVPKLADSEEKQKESDQENNKQVVGSEPPGLFSSETVDPFAKYER